MHDDHHHDDHDHHHDGDDHHDHPHAASATTGRPAPRSGRRRICRTTRRRSRRAASDARPRSGRDGFRRRLSRGRRTPTSFLRLAGIPFVGETATGTRLHLLRVETEDVIDVGAVMPLVGGAGVAYDPLPSRLTSRRRRLAFVYHDGTGPKHLGFGAARASRTDLRRAIRHPARQ